MRSRPLPWRRVLQDVLMGTIQHHALIFTSFAGREGLKEIHQYAMSIEAQPSEILGPMVNGYGFFFVPPDGSKEHWPASDAGNERRKLLVAKARALYIECTQVEWGELGVSIEGYGVRAQKYEYDDER